MTSFRTVMERHGWGQLAAVRAIVPAPCLPVDDRRGVQISAEGAWARKRRMGLDDNVYCYSWQGARTWD